ncbi:MAG: FG-GAP-like repeat-containing protein [Actinomycetota bacterium]
MDVRRGSGAALGAVLAFSTFASLVPAGAAADDALIAYLGRSDGKSWAYRSAHIGGDWARDSAMDIPDAGSNAHPTLADLDGDGDLDALVGESGGYVRAFRNDGSDGAPRWAPASNWDPKFDFDSVPAPATADLDRDGDQDLLVGVSAGQFDVVALENVGTRNAPAWAKKPQWNQNLNGSYPRPATADFNRDGKTDLVVGLRDGSISAFLGTGNATAPFTRAPQWDTPDVGSDAIPGAADVDGNGRPDLLVINTGAQLKKAFRNTGNGFAAQTSWVTQLNAGSGPGGIAILRAAGGSSTPPTTRPPNTTPPTTGPNGNHAPDARIAATPASGVGPLQVTLDASTSADADRDPLTYTFDFGDGTAGTAAAADAGQAVTDARVAYRAADEVREKGGDANKRSSVPMYLAAAAKFAPLTGITSNAPFTDSNFRRIDQISRLFLMRIGHDLGALYLYNDADVHDLDGCARYAFAYLYSRESEEQARLGGFPGRTDANRTAENVGEAKLELQRRKCTVPAYRPMLPVGPGAPTTGARATHTYGRAGTYSARVTVSDGTATDTATVQITVREPGDTTPTTTTPGSTTPSGPGSCTNAPAPPSSEPLQGFGVTSGGNGGELIIVCTPTEAAVKAALAKAKTNSNAGKKSRIVFTTRGPITVNSPLNLTANNVTVEGNGVTLVGGPSLAFSQSATFAVGSQNVIVRDMRFRNGGDNVRAQGEGAKNIVFSHISSTGAKDDGISIGYGAKNVTVQYSFFAGNTRSIFIKYKGVDNVTLHHNWVQKQWVRGPLANEAFVDFRNNIVEDWVLWGVRYENDASGNVVNSIFGYGSYANSTFRKPGNGLNVDTADELVYVAGVEYRGAAKTTDNARGTEKNELPAPMVTTQSVKDMEGLVRGAAGAMPRDSVDQAYINLTGPWTVSESTPLRLGG